MECLTRRLSHALLRARTSSRRMATQAKAKKEGDISSVFVSLSGAQAAPLPERYTEIKRNLIRGNEKRLAESWQALLPKLATENELVAKLGPNVVPQIDFKNLGSPSDDFISEVKKRGAAVVRGVVPRDEARAYKNDVEDYVRINPWTKGFPAHQPAVYELYWSTSQVRARSHPNMLAAQKFLMSFWSQHKDAPISTAEPLSYADRLRIRQPGDSEFALGPHIDGGSVERWEPTGYGLGGVYDKVWQGKWDEYDPWEASCRTPAVSDLYQGAGACSMFRMFQGWLSMSDTGPNEGTLKVNPLLQLSTAYFLLRPFFTPIHPAKGLVVGQHDPDFLNPSNWVLKSETEMTSELQGANPGNSQELNQVLHPHLELDRTMVHIPPIQPGDLVVWHCDTIHAVDKVHMGNGDSSVMYIPVCPITEANANYLARQRDTFLAGLPGPDFPGGKGESEHTGRPTVTYLQKHLDNAGLRAMGLEKLSIPAMASTGAKTVTQKANAVLGFA